MKRKPKVVYHDITSRTGEWEYLGKVSYKTPWETMEQAIEECEKRNDLKLLKVDNELIKP